MEYLAQLFRALANYERLKLLRLLAVFGELRVSELAAALSVQSAIVSVQVGVLSKVNIVWKRRSGKAVFYRLAERPGSEVLQQVIAVLRQAYATTAATSPAEVAAAASGDSPSPDASLFACFTAFTHPRRLQLIRHLTTTGPTDLDALAVALSMSERACLRHLNKLARRGYIVRSPSGRNTTYDLAAGEGPLQQSLLTAVQKALGDRKIDDTRI